MILVTGANGFLGSEIVKKLVSQGSQVRVMVREDSDLNSIQNVLDLTEKVHADVMDYNSLVAAMDGITQIYHTAAMVSFAPKDQKKMMEINVIGTQNVVNAALEKKVKRLLHVSSIASLGRSESLDMIDEKTHWQESNHNSPYAKSKYLGELEVWRGAAEGLEVIVVNPAIILGAGAWQKGTGKFFQMAYDSFPFTTKGVNAWVDVADVAAISIALMENKSIQGERFILSAGNYSYNYIFGKISDAFDKKHAKYILKPFLGNILWRLAEGWAFITRSTPFITRYSMNTALQISEYNNSKLFESIPTWKYTQIEDTIESVANIYKTIRERN